MYIVFFLSEVPLSLKFVTLHHEILSNSLTMAHFYCFQEVADKGSKITQLENEKSALIRDLFNNKAAGKNGFGPKKGNKIF